MGADGALQVVTGDNEGRVLVFSEEGHILFRATVGGGTFAATCIIKMRDGLGSSNLLVGDRAGFVSCVWPADSKWTVRACEAVVHPDQTVAETKSSGDSADTGVSGTNAAASLQGDNSILCLAAAELEDATGTICHYAVASHGKGVVRFIAQGLVAATLVCPDRVTALCVGRFATADRDSVLCGCHDGYVVVYHVYGVVLSLEMALFRFTDTSRDGILVGHRRVYLIDNFVLTTYIHVGVAVTNLGRIAPFSTVESVDGDAGAGGVGKKRELEAATTPRDLFLVGGHFAGLRLYCARGDDGAVVLQHECELLDWCVGMTVSDRHVAIATANGTVKHIEVLVAQGKS
jgi:hypothetical protein